jgi:vacuolar-type H+-ATPase subunit C/Vma6
VNQMTPQDKNLFMAGIESFKWDSEDQKQGYLAWIKFLEDRGSTIPFSVDLRMAWLIQKEREGYKWIQETFGNQISDLQGEIRGLQKQIMDSRQIINLLQMNCENLTGRLNENKKYSSANEEAPKTDGVR